MQFKLRLHMEIFQRHLPPEDYIQLGIRPSINELPDYNDLPSSQQL